MTGSNVMNDGCRYSNNGEEGNNRYDEEDLHQEKNIKRHRVRASYSQVPPNAGTAQKRYELGTSRRGGAFPLDGVRRRNLYFR